MSGLLNERITALRKERGFTQEQLGQMVGVSAQAVSKWEKGGFPDVELLPAVAGALGVTIDALFGRDAGERIDAAEVVRRWLRTMPQSQRMDQLSELVWAAASLTVATHSDDDRLLSGKRDQTCQGVFTLSSGEDLRWLRRIRVIGEEGLILGFRAEDMSWVSIFPEPETGWEPFLESNDRYRSLFGLLARPYCLELLEYLNSKPPYTARRYTPEAIAGALGLELAETEALLEALTKTRLLTQTELETKDGLIYCYVLNDQESLVPFLCLSRWLIAGDGGYINVTPRKRPVLRGEMWKEKEN